LLEKYILIGKMYLIISLQLIWEIFSSQFLVGVGIVVAENVKVRATVSVERTPKST